jgi:hypothetical protein
MVTAKERILNAWLTIVAVLGGLVGVVSFVPAWGGAFFGFIAGAFKSLMGLLLLGIAISFPIVCLGSSLGILLLKRKNQRLALQLSLLPPLFVILVWAGFVWSDVASRSNLLQSQGNTSSLAECVSPVFDGGDSLETTGCSVLEAGVTAAGVTKSISEAHNWQFFTESTQVAITIESNESCPQIRILDSGGKVIESFEERNATRMCPSGMVTTAFYNLNLPASGTYILRLITPETPGAYWIKIR